MAVERLPPYPGYFRVSRYYVSHTLFMLALALLMALGLALLNIVQPWLDGWLRSQEPLPTFQVNRRSMQEYEGRARLVDTRGHLLYIGEISGGHVNGWGTVYGDGLPVYIGDFANDQFNGSGTLYDTQGVVYEGGFSENRFHGEGRLYADEELVYEGGFVNGAMEGAGRMIQDGEVVYTGQWETGRFEGQGKRYERESLLYKGEFSKGLYHGEGTLYWPETGYLHEVGRFYYGELMASGARYDEKGRLIVPEPPRLDPLSLLYLGYDTILARLEESEVEYRELTGGRERLILLDSADIILRIPLASDTGQPLSCVAVSLCGFGSAGKVAVGLPMTEVELLVPLTPERALEALTDAQTMALNLANVIWGRTVPPSEIYARSYEWEDKTVTVYYNYIAVDPPFKDGLLTLEQYLALPSEKRIGIALFLEVR